MSNSVGIIDYGSGNFQSVCNWVDASGVNFGPISETDDFAKYSHIVLPGVGSYRGAISKLAERNLIGPIADLISREAKPFLGICVGMQVMTEMGLEFGATSGLAVIDGTTELLVETDEQSARFILPHIGWNSVSPHPDSKLFSGLSPEDLEFYFLHSYHVASSDPRFLFSKAFYGQEFNAAFERGSFFCVQFHPEKSQQSGIGLLKKFLEF